MLYKSGGIRYIARVTPPREGGSHVSTVSDREASVLGRPHREARLDKYPGLRAKVEGMLDIVEKAGGDIEKAAVAAQRVIDAMRALGHDALQQWAHEQQAGKAAASQATPGVNRKEKNALRVHAIHPAGNTNCHDQSVAAFGYLRSSAPGSTTRPNPAPRSA